MADDLTITQAMQAVYDTFSLPPIGVDEFTVRQYAEAHNLTIKAATRQLDQAVKAGMLCKRRVISGGRECKAYKVCANGS